MTRLRSREDEGGFPVCVHARVRAHVWGDTENAPSSSPSSPAHRRALWRVTHRDAFSVSLSRACARASVRENIPETRHNASPVFREGSWSSGRSGATAGSRAYVVSDRPHGVLERLSLGAEDAIRPLQQLPALAERPSELAFVVRERMDSDRVRMWRDGRHVCPTTGLIYATHTTEVPRGVKSLPVRRAQTAYGRTRRILLCWRFARGAEYPVFARNSGLVLRSVKLKPP